MQRRSIRLLLKSAPIEWRSSDRHTRARLPELPVALEFREVTNAGASTEALSNSNRRIQLSSPTDN
jgi:hypothetical protein